MTKHQVAELLRETEAELQAAQREHDGTGQAAVRYRDARDRHVQAERLARVTLAVSPAP
jgi:mRNA-degrading endonuclease YafQ of YafQ-DinJ toxin-antitoxin module